MGVGFCHGCSDKRVRDPEFRKTAAEPTDRKRGVSKTLRSRATVLFHKLPVIHAEPTTNSSPPRDTQMPGRLSRNVWCV